MTVTLKVFMEGKFYTVQEFAKKMNMSPRAVLNAIKAKRIYAFRPGYGKKSPWRIHESEILRIMNVDYETTLQNRESS